MSIFTDTLREFSRHLLEISRDADLQALRISLEANLRLLLRVGDAAGITTSGRAFLTRLVDHALARLDRFSSLRSIRDQQSERLTTIAELTRQSEMAQDQIYQLECDDYQ